MAIRRGALGRALMALTVAATLAACAAPRDDAGGNGPSADGRGYDCNGRPVDPVAFDDARPAASMPTEQRAIVEAAMADMGVPVDLDVDQWIVVASSDQRIDIMRRWEQGDRAVDPLYDWELATISVLGAGGWMVTSIGQCLLSHDLSPLTAAEIALDPASPPAPSSRDLALLVTERACNNGQDAGGRVRLVELIETDTAITVTIGVDRAGMDGSYTCPGNPPTPFTVTLAVPLDDRAILNGNLVDPRPVEFCLPSAPCPPPRALI